MAGILTIIRIQGSQYVRLWEHRHKVKGNDILPKGSLKAPKVAENRTMILNLPVLFDSNRCWLLFHCRIIVLMCVSSVCLPSVP